MKSLLKRAETNVHFKCDGIWHVQSNGLAMGASQAVILAKTCGQIHLRNLISLDLIKTGSANTATEE